jgi:hypothetical protein
MQNVLRDFYYLDDKTLRNYVSTIEDGIEMEKQTSMSKESPNWNFELSTGELQKILIGLGIPIPDVAIGRSGKTQSVSINRTAQPTTSSLYNRLETYLEPALQYLEGFDKAIWDQIEEGTFVKFNSTIELSRGYEYGKMFTQVGDFMQLASALELELEGAEDDKLQQALKYGEKVTDKKTQKIKVIPTGSPTPTQMYFVSSLNTDFLEVELEDMVDNNYTVVGRVEKVLAEGEKYTIFDPTLTGIQDSLNREQRRANRKQANQGNDAFSESDLYAEKPAIIMKPVAFYK